MEPEVRYCTTTDGVRIAYTVTGEGPPIVSCSEPIVSHVQLEWSHSMISRLLAESARYNTLIRFDLRGSGLSDRALPQALEEWVQDIETVVQATGFRRFALISSQTATMPAIAFASRHPDQISRLAVLDGFARSSDFLTTPPVRALVTAAGIDWVMATEATGSIAFGVGSEESRAHGAYVRSCIDPEYLTRIDQFAGKWDVTELARTIKAPTLVIKHADVHYVTMEMAKDLAARIPGAQLAIVKGAWADDPEGLARRWVAFLNPGVERSPAAGEIPSGTAIILFADIVDSTALTERLGDDAFHEKARGLDGAMRNCIRANGGTAVEGKTLGDGVLAVFMSAKQAIACAQACHEVARAAGETLVSGTVRELARTSAVSAAGETLVSGTVRELARTSAGVVFEDRGEQALKGIEEPVRVWAVRQA